MFVNQAGIDRLETLRSTLGLQPIHRGIEPFPRVLHLRSQQLFNLKHIDLFLDRWYNSQYEPT